MFHGLTDHLERWTFQGRGARRVIAVSDRLRADLRHYYGRADGVRRIYHGVDLETFHPRNRDVWRGEIRRQTGLAEDACAALYVGDFQKGLPAAIRALARVPHLHLLAVSASPAGPFRALIDGEGMAERVHLLPATTQIERYYAAADIFVFPSFYDSFGMVVTEAMASGLPVVCSMAAGAAELIDDGVNGLVVSDPWDATAMAAAIGRLVGDPELRRRLGAAARRSVEPYTWDAVARQTMDVYREVAGS
jgi:glycosyltransferase involved in cell wall biosynthesis